MHGIEQWMATGADLNTGRALYNRLSPTYKPSAVKKAQINGHDNDFTRQMLSRELGAILALINAQKAPISPPQSPPVAEAPPETDPNLQLPDDIKAMLEGVPMLYKQRDEKRYKKFELPEGHELRRMAMEIVHLDQKIRKVYRLRDYWLQYGTYPPGYSLRGDNEESELVSKLTMWLRAQRTFPAKISRYAKMPEKAAEVEAMRTVMDEIKNYLDADQEE